MNEVFCSQLCCLYTTAKWFGVTIRFWWFLNLLDFVAIRVQLLASTRLMAQADIQLLELNDFVLTLVTFILICFNLLECLVSLF